VCDCARILSGTKSFNTEVSQIQLVTDHKYKSTRALFMLDTQVHKEESRLVLKCVNFLILIAIGYVLFKKK